MFHKLTADLSKYISRRVQSIYTPEFIDTAEFPANSKF